MQNLENINTENSQENDSLKIIGDIFERTLNENPEFKKIFENISVAFNLVRDLDVDDAKRLSVQQLIDLQEKIRQIDVGRNSGVDEVEVGFKKVALKFLYDLLSKN